MPRYAHPKTTAHLESVISAFGNLTRVAIIGFLAQNGPATRGEVAAGLNIGVATAKHNLQLLTEEGITSQDPPATEERNGMRVRYQLERDEVLRRYKVLGEALGVVPKG
jgi:DNA-binding transcriptional ArsR family regulator